MYYITKRQTHLLYAASFEIRQRCTDYILKKPKHNEIKKTHTHFQTINNNSLLPILFINVSIENINSIQIWKQNLPSEQYGMIMGRQVVTVINPRPEVLQRLVSVE